MEEDILTTEEVAKYIKISEKTVLEWAKKGDIPAGKLGNVWRFRKSEIEQWLNDKLKNKKSAENIISDLKHLLAPERILISNYSTKRDILTALIDNISTAPQIKDRKKLEEGIWEREKLMSTGIGLGIGIPHIRSNAVKDIVVSVAINKTDIIDYKALDNKAVRIVFMVAAAQNQHAEYLKLLASIGSMLQSETLMDKLLLEDDFMRIYKLLTEGE